MKNTEKILIGGQALRELGHDRHTNDTDYLVNDITTKEAFITSTEVDYLNANGNSFFAEIYAKEEGNSIASANSLLELKAYAFVQHCQNFNFDKADACEYDIKFLVRKFGAENLNIVKKYIAANELAEVEQIIKSVK